MCITGENIINYYLINYYLACIAVIAWGKGAWDVRKNQKIGQCGEGEESVHLCAN